MLVAVAERDTMVPARFGVALHAALTSPKRLAVIPAAEHNDWIDHVVAARWHEMIDFLLGESD